MTYNPDEERERRAQQFKEMREAVREDQRQQDTWAEHLERERDQERMQEEAAWEDQHMTTFAEVCALLREGEALHSENIAGLWKVSIDAKYGDAWITDEAAPTPDAALESVLGWLEAGEATHGTG